MVVLSGEICILRSFKCSRQSEVLDQISCGAAIPVHQQEDKIIVSPEKEASQDCLDSHIQEAAQEGMTTTYSLTHTRLDFAFF